MMKGGRDSGKVMGPLFPRLHVNDADKGGPRAPPRNKMALYEQFSIPSSQRFNRGSSSSMQFPASSSSDVASSASISQKAMPFQFHLPPQPPASISKEHQLGSANEKNNHISMLELAKSSSKSSGLKPLNDSGHGMLRMTRQTSSPDKLSIGRNSFQKRNDDEGDYSVPTIDKDQLDIEKPSQGKNMKWVVTATSTHAKHFSKPHETLVLDMKTKKYMSDNENAVGERLKMLEHGDCIISTLSSREKRMTLPLNEEQVTKEANGLEMLEIQSRMPSQEFDGNDKFDVSKCPLNSFASKNRDVSGVRNGPRKLTLDASLLQNHKTNLDNCKGVVEVPQQIEELGNNDAESGSSMLDSQIAFSVSPDDVHKVMGPKNYWKTRQALRTQQRVFADQVFELHRLIKVQKTFASSPSTLLEGTCFPELRETSDMNLYSNSKQMMTSKQQTIPIIENKQEEKKIDHDNGFTQEATHDVHMNEIQVDETPKSGHCIGDSSAVTCSAEGNPPMPWCFPIPGNQWLIPVMSPSEGLVYKPCAAPYPPNFGFVGPAFGGFGPMPMPMPPYMGGAFPFPLPNQQQNFSIPASYYMNPHGIPISTRSTSSVEQVQIFANSTSKDLVEVHPKCSENYLNLESDAFSGNNRKIHALHELELQGSTASTPSEKVNDTVLQSSSAASKLMPHEVVERPVRTSHAQVIKVVPHNGKTATESAARIFQSIQKERLLNNLM